MHLNRFSLPKIKFSISLSIVFLEFLHIFGIMIATNCERCPICGNNITTAVYIKLLQIHTIVFLRHSVLFFSICLSAFNRATKIYYKQLQVERIIITQDGKRKQDANRRINFQHSLNPLKI